VTDRTSSRSLTLRERACPHADMRTEQAGQASSRAASTTSTRSGVIAINSIDEGRLAHRYGTLPEAITAGKGRLACNTSHKHADARVAVLPRRSDRERREGVISGRS